MKFRSHWLLIKFSLHYCYLKTNTRRWEFLNFIDGYRSGIRVWVKLSKSIRWASLAKYNRPHRDHLQLCDQKLKPNRHQSLSGPYFYCPSSMNMFSTEGVFIFMVYRNYYNNVTVHYNNCLKIKRAVYLNSTLRIVGDFERAANRKYAANYNKKHELKQ